MKEYLLQLENLQTDLVATRAETLNACAEKGRIAQELTGINNVCQMRTDSDADRQTDRQKEKQTLLLTYN